MHKNPSEHNVFRTLINKHGIDQGKVANNGDACPVQGLHTESAFATAVGAVAAASVYRRAKEYLKFNVYSVFYTCSSAVDEDVQDALAAKRPLKLIQRENFALRNYNAFELRNRQAVMAKRALYLGSKLVQFLVLSS